MLACHMCLCIRHLELLFTHFKPRDYEAKKVYCKRCIAPLYTQWHHTSFLAAQEKIVHKHVKICLTNVIIINNYPTKLNRVDYRPILYEPNLQNGVHRRINVTYGREISPYLDCVTFVE